MTFDWYRIFSLPEFLATGLVSRELTVTLEGRGEKSILITQGNTVGVTYEGTFLSLEFGARNPFIRDGLALFRGSEDYVWLGIEVAE